MTRPATAALAAASVCWSLWGTPGLATGAPADLSGICPGDDAYKRAVATYAACLVTQAAPALPKFLTVAWADPRSSGALGSLAQAAPQCARPKRKAQFGPEPLAVRGALFEALHARDFGPPAAPPSFRDVPRFAYLAPRSGDNRIAQMITAGMLAIFDCVVRQQPAKAAAMLSQQVESDAERSAFSKLRPAFAACLPPDQQFKMRASNVRPYIAETFYTLTRLSGGSPPPVPTEPAGAD